MGQYDPEGRNKLIRKEYAIPGPQIYLSAYRFLQYKLKLAVIASQVIIFWEDLCLFVVFPYKKGLFINAVSSSQRDLKCCIVEQLTDIKKGLIKK